MKTLLALLLTVLALPVFAQGKAIERHALVIGSNDGGPGRVKLRYAATDARSVRVWS